MQTQQVVNHLVGQLSDTSHVQIFSKSVAVKVKVQLTTVPDGRLVVMWALLQSTSKDD